MTYEIKLVDGWKPRTYGPPPATFAFSIDVSKLNFTSTALGSDRVAAFTKAVLEHFVQRNDDPRSLVLEFPTLNRNQTGCRAFGPVINNIIGFIRQYKTATVSMDAWISSNPPREGSGWVARPPVNGRSHRLVLQPKQDIFNASHSMVFENVMTSEMAQVYYSEDVIFSVTLHVRGIPINLACSNLCSLTNQNIFEKHVEMFSNRMNDIKTDFVIVAPSQKDFKCHKLLLAGASPVFRTMLNNDKFIEGRSNKILIPDTDDSAIKGLLAFVYCDVPELMQSMEDFEGTFGILKLADKYAITPLKQLVKQHMCSKPEEWFPVEGLLLVYAYCFVIDDLEDLNRYTGEIIKMHYHRIRKLDYFTEWFKQLSPMASLKLLDLCLKPK